MRNKRGFALTGMLMAMLVAALLYTSGTYVGEYVKETEAALTMSLLRDARALSAVVDASVLEHSEIRRRILAGEAGAEPSDIIDLWQNATLKGKLEASSQFLKGNPSVTGFDVTAVVSKTELVDGISVPSMINIRLRITTNRNMNSGAAREERWKLLRLKNVTDARLDDASKRTAEIDYFASPGEGTLARPMTYF